MTRPYFAFCYPQITYVADDRHLSFTHQQRHNTVLQLSANSSTIALRFELSTATEIVVVLQAHDVSANDIVSNQHAIINLGEAALGSGKCVQSNICCNYSHDLIVDVSSIFCRQALAEFVITTIMFRDMAQSKQPIFHAKEDRNTLSISIFFLFLYSSHGTTTIS